MEATAELKKSWGVIKAHWLLIAIIVFLVVGFALYYDLKPDKKGKTGRFTEFYGGLPFAKEKFAKVGGEATGGAQ